MALNANAAVLHYQNQEPAAPSELRSFLIDADAQFNGYAADVTRTYSQGQDDFASMIAAMNEAQLALCSQVRPWGDYAAIHLDAHQRIGKVLRERRAGESDAAGVRELKHSGEAERRQKATNCF